MRFTFSITDETFGIIQVGELERLLKVEDFIIFEGEEVFKMDASSPRLKPKTGADSKSGLAAQRQLQQNEQTKSAERSHDDRTNTIQRD